MEESATLRCDLYRYRPLLGISVGVALPARGEEVDVFVLEVDGLVREECRRSVEEKLRNTKNVVDVLVDIAAGEVTVVGRTACMRNSPELTSKYPLEPAGAPSQPKASRGVTNGARRLTATGAHRGGKVCRDAYHADIGIQLLQVRNVGSFAERGDAGVR
jgi:hypothetical protein